MTTVTNVRLPDLDTTPNDLFEVSFDRTITAIRRTAGATPAPGAVDGGGAFLVPGLIDTHVHLGSRTALTDAVRAGVTTLIDLGTHPDRLIAEQRTEQGVPSILSAGSAASAPGSIQIAAMGFPDISGVTGAADAERYLDWRAENDADLIKIIIEDPDATPVPGLAVETIAALVDGAHRRGLLTVAHVVTASSFVRGLDAGVDVLTHSPLDRPLPDDTVQRMLETRTTASPTLVMMRTMARARLGDRAEAAFGNAVESVRRMHAAGVPIIVGTDANEGPMAPVRHGQALHEELGLLQQAGLTAMDAVRAATSGAAAALRLTDRGRVAKGLRADLLLVRSDPRTDPAALRSPDTVWIGGIAA